MGNCRPISHTFYSIVLSTQSMKKMRTWVGLRESAKSVPCVPYVAAWSTCQVAYCQPVKSVPTSHFYVPKTCQFFNLVSQRSTACQFFKLAWQKACHFSNFACQEVCQLFNYFLKELYFLYTKYIYIPNIFNAFCIFEIYT